MLIRRTIPALSHSRTLALWHSVPAETPHPPRCTLAAPWRARTLRPGRHMMIKHRFVARVAALATLLAAPLIAQAGTADQGTFRVLVGGREVGTEQFTIAQTGSGNGAVLLATGRVSLRLPTGSLELTPRLRATGVGADPVHYEVDVGGDSPQRIAGNIGGGRVSAK